MDFSKIIEFFRTLFKLLWDFLTKIKGVEPDTEFLKKLDF